MGAATITFVLVYFYSLYRLLRRKNGVIELLENQILGPTGSLLRSLAPPVTRRVFLSSEPGDDSTKETAVRPRPVMTRDTSFFWEGAQKRHLLIQRCGACHTVRHPPTAACAECGKLEWDMIESSGVGEVYSYTVVHSPVVEPFQSPYVVALVALEEGVRLISEVIGSPPESLHIGMPVLLDWLECDEDLTLPVFRSTD